jgi:acyl-CoA thioester hydrolase
MAADPAPREARATIAIRWRDLDPLGHVNQAVYHELLEENRGALFASLEENAFPFVLARMELAYRNEVRRDHETVEVVCRVAKVGTRSVTTADQIVVPDGTVAAEGSSVLVAWDPKARSSRDLPHAERAALGGS